LGTDDVTRTLVEGLKRLEYRGCDVDRPRNLAKSVTVE
jgi:glucosamine 6-phosphate synthetase-like amidotransferase/phosphosugar isomerase protein